MPPRKRSRSTSRKRVVRKTSRGPVVRRKRSASRKRSKSRSRKRRKTTKTTSRKRSRSKSKGRKKLGRKMKQGEGYCVKCKAARMIKDGRVVTMKNGRKAMRGNCPNCGTGMFRIM